MTRFYFSSLAVPDVMPAVAAWSRTNTATRRVMSPTKDGSAFVIPYYTYVNGASPTGLIRQYVSAPMDAGIAFSTSDTIKCQCRVYEVLTTTYINRNPICVKVVSQDGTVLQSTLKALGHIGPSTTNWQENAPQTNRTFADSDTLDANYTTVSGDRLVVELGAQANYLFGVDYNVRGYIEFGSAAASDLPEDETDTTSKNPWFEISRTLTFLTITPPTPPVVACQSPLVGRPPTPDYKVTLCEVTTLAELMALSQDSSSGTPVEVAGKRMRNAAGLTLVADASSANKVRYVRLGSVKNAGENGYGYQNIQALWPARTYPDFWCRFIARKWEGGSCFEGDVGLRSGGNNQGFAFWRDSISGEIRLISFVFTQDSGDWTSPLTGPTFYNDIVQIDQYWRLLSSVVTSTDLRAYAITIIAKVNNVAVATRELTAKVTTSLTVPWSLLMEDQVYGDDAMEIHGWEFTYAPAQYGGVTAYVHTVADGTLRTTVDLGGVPKGGYTKWRPLGQPTLPKFPGIPDTVFKFLPVETGPFGVAGTALWWKADDLLATKSNNDAISFWSDASNNARHGIQATVAKQPTFLTNIKNGLPVVQTTTAPLYMISGADLSSATARFVCIVARRNGSVTAPNDSPRFLEWGSGANTATIYANSGTSSYTDPNTAFTASVDTNWNMYTIRITSGTSAQLYLNGYLMGSTFTPNAHALASGPVYLGIQSNEVNQSAPAQYAEVMVIDAVLTDAEVSGIHSYLVNKWAI